MEPVRRLTPLPLIEPPVVPGFLHAVPGAFHLEIPAGRALLLEGESTRCFFAVETGAVALTATASSRRAGVLEILGPGTVFGAVDPLQVSPRCACPPCECWDCGPRIAPEARALVASRLLTILDLDLRRAARTDAELACWLASALARRAAALEWSLARQLCLTLTERTLEVLEELARSHGRPVPGGVVIGIPLTQDTLSWMVHGTRESVNRALADLRARGLIERWEQTYALLGPDDRRACRLVAAPS